VFSIGPLSFAGMIITHMKVYCLVIMLLLNYTPYNCYVAYITVPRNCSVNQGIIQTVKTLSSGLQITSFQVLSETFTINHMYVILFRVSVYLPNYHMCTWPRICSSDYPVVSSITTSFNFNRQGMRLRMLVLRQLLLVHCLLHSI